MKIVAAVVMGFISGGLIYLMAGILSLTGVGHLSAIRLLLMLCAWAASTCGLLWRVDDTSAVLSRGFLLGAVEWTLMIGVGFLGAAIVGSGAMVRLAIIGGGSFLMALLCLAGFAVVHSRKKVVDS